MIQELFGSGLISGERRLNNPINNGTILQATPPPPPPHLPTYSHHHHHHHSSSPSLSPSTAPAAAATPSLTNASPTSSSSPSSAAAAGGGGEHLRCPRCDSSNTKFCYYNNYNLTQPRHFCKTCRRYWTKGGALRNVPIGGGCRKNRATSSLPTSSSSSSPSSLSAAVVSTFGKPTNKLKSLFDQELPSSPNILWPSPQGNSHHTHFLSLLRSSPPPNPNPSSTAATLPATTSSSAVKDVQVDGIDDLFGTSTVTTTAARTLGGWESPSANSQQPVHHLHGLEYFPPIPMWVGDSYGNGYLVGSDGPHHNIVMKGVYERAKGSTSRVSYNDDNVGSGSSGFEAASSSSTVAPAAGGGGFLGYGWNNTAGFSSSPAGTTATAAGGSWSDLPTTGNNGTAYR